MTATSKLFDLDFQLGSFKDCIDLAIKEKRSFSCFVNSHMLYEYHSLSRLEEALNEANFLFPDGMPITYSLEWINGVKQERIAGNDAIFHIVESAKENNLRLFFIGGSEKVLDEISRRLENVGVESKTYSPPFLPIENFNFDEQAKIIERYNPDVVLVGLGCPKQELWMYKMREKISAPMFGLGGAFLYFAGIDSRAPKWMRDLSLEWLYRLFLEPKRLFERYLITNTYFCYLFIKELLKRTLKRK